MASTPNRGRPEAAPLQSLSGGQPCSILSMLQKTLSHCIPTIRSPLSVQRDESRHFPPKAMKVATSRPKWQPIKSYFAGQEMATEVRCWDPPPEAVGANGNRVGREPMRTRHAAWQAAVERVFTLRGGDTTVRPEGDHHGTAGSLGRGARGKLEGQT